MSDNNGWLLNEYILPYFKWKGFSVFNHPSFYYRPEYNNEFISDWRDVKSYLSSQFQNKLISYLESGKIIVGHVQPNVISLLISNLIAKWILREAGTTQAYFSQNYNRIFIPINVTDKKDINWKFLEHLLAHEICHYLYVNSNSFVLKTKPIVQQWYKILLLRVLDSKEMANEYAIKLTNELIKSELDPLGSAEVSYKLHSELLEYDKNNKYLLSAVDLLKNGLKRSNVIEVYKQMNKVYSAISDTDPNIIRGQLFYQELMFPSEIICTIHSMVVSNKQIGLNKIVCNSM